MDVRLAFTLEKWLFNAELIPQERIIVIELVLILENILTTRMPELQVGNAININQLVDVAIQLYIKGIEHGCIYGYGYG